MFQQSCQTIRETVYGVKGTTPLGNNRANSSTGTGFMIAPGVLATAAHVIHFKCDFNEATHVAQNPVAKSPPPSSGTDETDEHLRRRAKTALESSSDRTKERVHQKGDELEE